MTQGPVGSDKHPWFIIVLQKTVVVAVRAEDHEAAFRLADQHVDTDPRELSLNNGWSAKATVGPLPGKIGDDEPPEHELSDL